jgi:hypothetical protein
MSLEEVMVALKEGLGEEVFKILEPQIRVMAKKPPRTLVLNR